MDRPWLALVFVPIGMAAAVVTLHLWLLLPLTIMLWWWASHEDPWTWVLGILEACFGVQWGFVGLYGLVAFPRHRVLVEVLWIGYALLIAGIGAINRWRFNMQYGM